MCNWDASAFVDWFRALLLGILDQMLKFVIKRYFHWLMKLILEIGVNERIDLKNR